MNRSLGRFSFSACVSRFSSRAFNRPENLLDGLSLGHRRGHGRGLCNRRFGHGCVPFIRQGSVCGTRCTCCFVCGMNREIIVIAHIIAHGEQAGFINRGLFSDFATIFAGDSPSEIGSGLFLAGFLILDGKLLRLSLCNLGALGGNHVQRCETHGRGELGAGLASWS